MSSPSQKILPFSFGPNHIGFMSFACRFDHYLFHFMLALRLHPQLHPNVFGCCACSIDLWLHVCICFCQVFSASFFGLALLSHHYGSFSPFLRSPWKMCFFLLTHPFQNPLSICCQFVLGLVPNLYSGIPRSLLCHRCKLVDVLP